VSSSRRRRLPLILVILAPVVVLWPVVSAEFIPLDDATNVARNPDFNPPALANLGHYWREPFLNMYAPLTYTTWAGVARVAWMDATDESGLQLNPYVFHAANLLVHVINAMLVYALLRKLGITDWACCAGALLFALHPMQVEPVGWVTGFRDLLATMFSLASLLAYVRFSAGRSWQWYAIACAALLAALLSKPTSVIVPLIAAALDWGVVGRPLRDVWKPIVGLLVLVLPFAILTKHWQSADLAFTPPLWFRPIIAADALVFYARQLVLPVNVGLDYGRSPQWLLAQGGWRWAWIAILPLAAVVWTLRRHRTILASIAIFVAAVLPVLGLTKFDFQHHSSVADRYVYLAMLGPALLVAMAISRGGRTAATVCAFMLLIFAMLSHVQARAWTTGESIYRKSLDANPDSLLANRGMGLLARTAKDKESYFLAALRTHPDDPVTNFNLGTLYLATGRARDAVAPLRIAAVARNQPWVTTNYANALAQSGDLEEAERILRAALADDPTSAELHATLAAVLFRRGDRAGSVEHYREALRLNPALTVVAQELAALEHSTTAPTPTTSPAP
jgi:cytochrome c-type biogenesis protein CcmH/NrfG